MEALNKFVRLNNHNWQTWKFRMEMLLTREDLWYVVETPKPNENPENWEKDDKKARATMGLCIEENQYGLIKSANSAAQFWSSLKKYHEKVTVISRVALLKKLCNLNLLESGDLKHHLFEVEDLFDRLTQAGQELDDSLKVAMILRSLPDSYSGLVTALESRPDEDLTVVLVKSKLLDEFERRKEGSVPGSSGRPGDLKALKSFGKRNVSVSEHTCFFCKQKGHLQSDCPVLQEQQKRKTEKKKKKSEPSAAKQAMTEDKRAVL